jgi:hypothetical protein
LKVTQSGVKLRTGEPSPKQIMAIKQIEDAQVGEGFRCDGREYVGKFDVMENEGVQTRTG